MPIMSAMDNHPDIEALRGMIDRLYREPHCVIDAAESLAIDAAITRATDAAWNAGVKWGRKLQTRA